MEWTQLLCVFILTDFKLPPNSWQTCYLPALLGFQWHFWILNAFFSICFPKSRHPLRGSPFARRTSVTISKLAGSTPNSSAETAASRCHLCPGPSNPTLSVNLSLSAQFFLFALCILQTLIYKRLNTCKCVIYLYSHGFSPMLLWNLCVSEGDSFLQCGDWYWVFCWRTLDPHHSPHKWQVRLGSAPGRANKGGVRKIGQDWMWGSHSPPVCLGLFCRWAYTAQCQSLKPNLDQTNEFVYCLDCEDLWDDR